MVRREWVKNLLAKKQAPKGWQYFTVHAITHHAETASGYEGKVAAEMVGAKVEDSNQWAWNPLRDHVAKTTARPEFALIALVCAGYEKTIQKDSWCSPSQTHRDYLNQLVAWDTPHRRLSRSSSTAATRPRRPDRPRLPVPGGGSRTPPGTGPHHRRKARSLPDVGRSAAQGEPQQHSPAADRRPAPATRNTKQGAAVQQRGWERTRPSRQLD